MRCPAESQELASGSGTVSLPLIGRPTATSTGSSSCILSPRGDGLSKRSGRNVARPEAERTLRKACGERETGRVCMTWEGTLSENHTRVL